MSRRICTCLLLLIAPGAAGCGSGSASPNTTPSSLLDTSQNASEGIHGQQAALLQQQLELEREKAALAEQRLQLQIDEERRQAQREREKREALEANAQRERDAEAAQQFTPREVESWRLALFEQHEAIGKVLLAETHPTGSYSSTSTPLVTTTTDRETIVVRMTVSWTGGFTDTPYDTEYSFRFTKRGFDRLEIVRDGSIIQASPEFIRDAENAIREVFDP